MFAFLGHNGGVYRDTVAIQSLTNDLCSGDVLLPFVGSAGIHTLSDWRRANVWERFEGSFNFVDV